MPGKRKRDRTAASAGAASVRETAAIYETEREAERPIRKNHYLYQWKIDKAREILGVATETEAIDMALDILLYGEALAAGTMSMVGAKYNDVLGIMEEVPPRDA